MNSEFDIKSDLMKDEIVLWKGHPNPSKHFTSKDIFLVPFSLMWGGGAIFWEYMVLTKFDSFSDSKIIFPLWGIPFVLLGLYFIFGRFIFKYKSKLHTKYFVTNFRVLIYKNLFSKSLTSLSLDTVPINMNQNNDGTGSLFFGNNSGVGNFYANTGMDFFTSYGGVTHAFYDIDDVKSVHQLIINTKKLFR